MKGKVIYKYQLGKVGAVAGRYEIEMPRGAKILTVENQDNKCVVYACVSPRRKKATYIFNAYPTGAPIGAPMKPKGKFLGTIMFYGEYDEERYTIHVSHIYHHKETLGERCKNWLCKKSGGD